MDRSFSTNRRERELYAEGGNAGALKRTLAEASRTPALLEESLQRYSQHISTLLENDKSLIRPSQLDAYIRALCPNVEALTGLNKAWYNGQLETLRDCGLILSIENPVITAVDGKEYQAPGLDQLRGRFTISHLLRIKRLDEGDGTPQNPPRSPVAVLGALGQALKVKFQGFTDALPKNFTQNGGEFLLQIDSDQPGRKGNEVELLYDVNKTKQKLVEEGRAWELVFIDGRPEMTSTEWREGNRHLNANELAERFQKQGFDLSYADDLLALHGLAVVREGGRPFDSQNHARALGNRLHSVESRRNGYIPYVSWIQYAGFLRLYSDYPEDAFDLEGSRATVRIR